MIALFLYRNVNNVFHQLNCNFEINVSGKFL